MDERHKNIVVLIVLVALIVISVVQAVELRDLREKITSDKISTAATRTSTQSTPTKIPSNLQNLPTMVGGC